MNTETASPTIEQLEKLLAGAQQAALRELGREAPSAGPGRILTMKVKFGPLAKEQIVAAFPTLLAQIKELREALREIAAEEFKAAPGMSIYAAAANELPRLKGIARQALGAPE